MTPFITEILSEINKTPDLLATKYRDNYAIKTLLQYAFNTNLKLILPEGTPPYKKETSPLGMTGANFYQQVKKLYVFTRADLTPVRRESLFIQFIEGIHPDEVDVIIAVKDQTLHVKYPNITPELATKVGFVTAEETFRSVVEPAKGGKSLTLKLDDSTTTRDMVGGKPAAPKPARAKTEKKDPKLDTETLVKELNRQVKNWAEKTEAPVSAPDPAPKRPRGRPRKNPL